MIPLAEATVAGNEVAYLRETVEDGWFSSSAPVVTRFEERLAATCGVRHAIATLSGTSALHLALATLGIGPGDDVIVSDMSFVASANAIRYCGACPVFADSRLDDWQLDVVALGDLIDARYARRSGVLADRETGRRLGAIMPVHLLGGLADLAGLYELAARVGVPVIEDAAQSMGATWRDQPLCAPVSGDRDARVVCTSFNGNKIVTCGNGGAVFCSDDRFARRARYLAATARLTQSGDYYTHTDIGFNYRMSALSAAVGIAQLETLAHRLARKAEIAAAYRAALSDLPGVVHQPAPGPVRLTHWVHGVLMPGDSRAAVALMGAADVECRTLWRPLRRQAPYRTATGAAHTATDRLWRRGMCVPCGHAMTDDDVRTVIAALRHTAVALAT